jgi:hypothetical protein
MTWTKKVSVSTLSCVAYWLTMMHWQHDAGTYAFGVWTGYLIADSSPLVRWWRIRRYRKYIDEQRAKQPPRAQPWDGRLSPNQIHAGSPTNLAFDTEGGVVNVRTGERVVTKPLKIRG